MNLIEKIIEEKIKRYGFRELTIVIILSVLLLSWFEHKLSWLESKIHLDMPEILYGTVLFIALIPLILIFLKILEDFLLPIYFRIRINFKNEINIIPPISGWIFQGSLNIENSFLEITRSYVGCLIKAHFYKNFIMSFNLKIPNGGRAGIIFRAQNLENYLMIKIELADVPSQQKTIIYNVVPYIRFFGNLETFNIDRREPYHPTNLKYSGGEGLSINLEVKDYSAIMKMKSNDEEHVFQWNIPTHTKPNIIEHQPTEEPLTEQFGGFSASKIWFRNKYGMIGFRADSLEKAIISDLKIEKI